LRQKAARLADRRARPDIDTAAPATVESLAALPEALVVEAAAARVPRQEPLACR